MNFFFFALRVNRLMIFVLRMNRALFLFTCVCVPFLSPSNSFCPHDADVHHHDLDEATYYMLRTQISELAEALNSRMLAPSDSIALVDEMHEGDWIGLDWTGLDWIGLDWTELELRFIAMLAVVLVDMMLMSMLPHYCSFSILLKSPILVRIAKYAPNGQPESTFVGWPFCVSEFEFHS